MAKMVVGERLLELSGGKCFSCKKRKPRLSKGSIFCGPCSKELLASAAAREAEEKAREAEYAAEHAFELRAAFGPGVKVVNIVTGESWVS